MVLGLKLSDLAGLYAALARGGEPVALTYRRGMSEQPKAPVASNRLLSPVAAWYVTDILRNAPAPANARSGQIAYKTGTSYGFRDAWAVGYDGRHTIAVWVGRPDGAATPGLAGRTAAAPILFDAFARLSARRAPLPSAPSGALVAAGGDLPPPLKRFRYATDDSTWAVSWSRRCRSLSRPIVPRSRSTVAMRLGGREGRGGRAAADLAGRRGADQSDPARREAEFPASGLGFHKLSVIDAKGRADRVTIRLK